MTVNVDMISDINSYGIDIKNRELFLHSYIANNDEDPGVDHKMAASFYKTTTSNKHRESSVPHLA